MHIFLGASWTQAGQQSSSLVHLLVASVGISRLIVLTMVENQIVDIF